MVMDNSRFLDEYSKSDENKYTKSMEVFDTSMIQVGSAVKLQKAYFNMGDPFSAIVIVSEPLAITVAYMHKNDMKTEVITIEEVTTGKIKIKGVVF